MDQPAQPTLPEQPEAAPAFSAQTNTLAIVSLVSGIVSWFAVPVIGGIVAVITGHMARREIQRTGEQGGTMATVGLVLGYLHLAVVVLILGFIMLILIGTFAAIRTTSG